MKIQELRVICFEIEENFNSLEPSWCRAPHLPPALISEERNLGDESALKLHLELKWLIRMGEGLTGEMESGADAVKIN